MCYGRTRIREHRQVKEGQCKNNRPQKVLTANPWKNINNSSQVQGDYNTREP